MKMKAYTRNKYGGPEVLRLEDVDRPTLEDQQILVKTKANSVNPADWHVLRGEPRIARIGLGLFKPKNRIIGADFAGIVEEVGRQVTNFKVGDRVFGEAISSGTFAEYISVPARYCAKIPDEADFSEMAGVPVAGLTALQGLITHGRLKKGESILINGSSGGVGHFAIQIARAYGAEVTGVCSSGNVDFVRSLGAHHVIAYDQVDIHNHTGRYDIVMDNHGNLVHGDYVRMGSRGIMIGMTTVSKMIRLFATRAFKKFPIAQFVAAANTRDLETLATLYETGKIKTHIDRTYPHTEIPEAITYIEDMHTRGKVVIVW